MARSLIVASPLPLQRATERRLDVRCALLKAPIPTAPLILRTAISTASRNLNHARPRPATRRCRTVQLPACLAPHTALIKSRRVSRRAWLHGSQAGRLPSGAGCPDVTALLCVCGRFGTEERARPSIDRRPALNTRPLLSHGRNRFLCVHRDRQRETARRGLDTPRGGPMISCGQSRP
jgi:hypothetical protein